MHVFSEGSLPAANRDDCFAALLRTNAGFLLTVGRVGYHHMGNLGPQRASINPPTDLVFLRQHERAECIVALLNERGVGNRTVDCHYLALFDANESRAAWRGICDFASRSPDVEELTSAIVAPLSTSLWGGDPFAVVGGRARVRIGLQLRGRFDQMSDQFGIVGLTVGRLSKDLPTMGKVRLAIDGWINDDRADGLVLNGQEDAVLQMQYGDSTGYHGADCTYQLL